jgi:hypothetical protein
VLYHLLLGRTEEFYITGVLYTRGVFYSRGGRGAVKVLLAAVGLKCRQVLLLQVLLGPGAGGGINQGQLRNIALCSQLQEVHRWCRITC